MLQQPQQGMDPAQLFVWVKSLETKVNNLLREVDIIKNDFMKKNNNLKQEVKSLNEDIMDIKHSQSKVELKIDLIIKELQQTAGKEEVAILKKYMEFWNPLNFVTQRDVERVLEEKMVSLKRAARKTVRKKTAKKRKK